MTFSIEIRKTDNHGIDHFRAKIQEWDHREGAIVAWLVRPTEKEVQLAASKFIADWTPDTPDQLF